MGVVEGAIVVGGALSLYGQLSANEAEARARRANEKLYREQAALTLEAAKREQNIFDMESEQFYGSQVNAFAKGGVDLSGSALLYLAGTKQQMANESSNILLTGQRNANFTLLKAQQEGDEAKRLSSFENQAITGVTSALGTGSLLAARRGG